MFPSANTAASDETAPANRKNAYDEKRRLRRFARELRAAHANDEPVSFLSALTRRPEWRAARTVLLYLPYGVEPPTADLMADVRARGGRVAVPAWDPATASYAPALLPAGATLAPDPSGIPGPAEKIWLPPADIDLYVLPGLLFDETGTRLGHGRGHLDRLLAARRPGAAVFGLAFPWQLAPAPLPREAHDVPMDAVLFPCAQKLALHPDFC